MLIKIYESVVNEDDTRTPGRLVGEIKCSGDGTPGEFAFFDTCNEVWDVKDPSCSGYIDKRVIFEDIDKEILQKKLFQKVLYITDDGGEVDGVEFSIPVTLKPWYRETIEYIIQYEIPVWFGTICARIIED